LPPIGSAAALSKEENTDRLLIILRQNIRMSFACAKRQLIPTIAIGISSIGQNYTTNLLAFTLFEVKENAQQMLLKKHCMCVKHLTLDKRIILPEIPQAIPLRDL
jgi:hypothetical protein